MQATPLLRRLGDRQPASRTIVVSFDTNAGLLRRLDVRVELRLIRTHSPIAFVLDVLSTIVWLRRQRVQTVVDLEFFSKFSTLLSALSGARVRIAFHLNDYWRHLLVTHPIYYNYYHHISEVYAEAAGRLGLAIDDPSMARVNIGDSARAAVDRFLESHVPVVGELVGVNVNAGDLSLARR